MAESPGPAEGPPPVTFPAAPGRAAASPTKSALIEIATRSAKLRDVGPLPEPTAFRHLRRDRSIWRNIDR